MKKHIALLMGLLVGAPIIVKAKSKSPDRHVNKVYVHEGNFSRKIILHFTSDPVVAYAPRTVDETTKRENGLLKMTFHLPSTAIKGKDNQEALKALSGMHSKDYGISFYEGATPKDGVKCLVMFNPDKVGFEYKMFESITGAKGIMFEFHDQKKLKHLSSSSKTIKRHASAQKPKVILDFGHGGKDGGFSNDTVQEKEINRQVGLKVASLLKKKGMQVCLTRKGDEYLSLDQRTAATRSCQDAKLLVSIHSNASTHKGAHGIETFCNHGSLFKTKESFMNDTVKKHAYDFNTSLTKKSNMLAREVHSKVLGHAKTRNKNLKDRKVKHNVAQLFVGTEVPSVLIELGFLSHEREGRLLQTDAYQLDLAKGICAGIETYLKREVV